MQFIVCYHYVYSKILILIWRCLRSQLSKMKNEGKQSDRSSTNTWHIVYLIASDMTVILILSESEMKQTILSLRLSAEKYQERMNVIQVQLTDRWFRDKVIILRNVPPSILQFTTLMIRCYIRSTLAVAGRTLNKNCPTSVNSTVQN